MGRRHRHTCPSKLRMGKGYGENDEYRAKLSKVRDPKSLTKNSDADR